MTPCEVCGSEKPVHTHRAPVGSQFGDTLVVRTPVSDDWPEWMTGLLPERHREQWREAVELGAQVKAVEKRIIAEEAQATRER